MTIIQYVVATVMFTVSLYGIFINVLVLYGFSRRIRFRTSFYIFCRSRTITNTITCLAFLLWAAPCTFLGQYFLPHWANVFWGQIAGCGAYACGLLVDCAVAGNRFFATYFPLNFRNHNHRPAYIALFICWIFGAFVFIIGLRDSCGYVYNIHLLSWAPEETPCSQNFSDKFFIVVCVVTSATGTVSNGSSIKSKIKNKTRRNQRLFVQSLIQASFYLIDMVFCQLLYKLSDAIWFRFICMGFVWLSIHVLDGTVMLLYNKDMFKKKQVMSLAKTKTDKR